MLAEDTERDPTFYINRELSWLQFNSRVLAQAEDKSVPLLERFKFCAIYASNLDEFFMVRVAGLKDQIAAGLLTSSADGMSPLAQLGAIQAEVQSQAERLESLHVDVLLPALRGEGNEILNWSDLDEQQAKQAASEFENRIFPVLTPLAVDQGHPFPYISNLSLNLAVSVEDPSTGGHRFARLKMPTAMPRLLPVSSDTFVPIEQVITAHIGHLFQGMNVVGAWPFRVTRNSDLILDDTEAEDLLEAVEVELRRRRFGRAIRLEITDEMPTETIEWLQQELDLDLDEVHVHRGMLDCTAYWDIQHLDRADLKYPNFVGVTPSRLRELEGSRDLFDRIKQHDILLHHPYESFNASVVEFVRQAAADQSVLAIKMTLYRTSGDSPIIDSLIRAAEAGKQVAALIELKARFDEQANIEWARRLEQVGVHVVYGLLGLKTHAKTILVVREEPEGVRSYCHIGSGNYNSKTARVYEDLGIITADPDVGDDLTQLFNFLTGYGRDVRYDRLLVAPPTMREPLKELIEGEMAAPAGTGRIVAKMNSLVDADLIDLLYAASEAGVEIDLIVRGICCLRPGVEGLSSRIRVRSIVGRYLEHSRVYYFANGDGPARGRYYIGSPDLMPRNLDRRVEVLISIENEVSRQRMQEALTVNLESDRLAWVLGPDGVYKNLGGNESSQERFSELARERARESR